MASSKKSSQIPRNRLSVSTIPFISSVRSLAAYYTRYHHNLLGSTIKLFNTLYSFTRLNFEGGRATCALFIEDALGFSDSRYGFRVTHSYFFEIPLDPLITSPGHNAQHTHVCLPFSLCFNNSHHS